MLGLIDQSFALIAQLGEQVSNANLVVVVGALERGNFVVNQRFQLSSAGERPLWFGGVLVRVNPQYRLSMHVDTDEANAGEIDTGTSGFIEAVEESV